LSGCAPARIVNVASAGQVPIGFDDVTRLALALADPVAAAKPVVTNSWPAGPRLRIRSSLRPR